MGAMAKPGSALALVVLATLLACAEQRADRSPDATLAAAVARTNAAGSFQVRMTVTDGRDQHVSLVEYVAPDRVRIKLRPVGETVWIAGDTYYATPDEPGRFVLVETGCENALEMAVPALGIVRDVTDVRRNGPIFTFRSANVARMTGQAEIENGHLGSLLLRYDLPDSNRKMIEQYSFSRFGDDISIRRPDASLIQDSQEAAPNQGSLVPCPEAQATDVIEQE
jgi:hypothetical protein